MAGMCKYSDLYDGTLGLIDVYVLNELIAVKSENERRAMKEQEKKNGNRS